MVEARGLEGPFAQMLCFPHGTDGRADMEIRRIWKGK